LTAVATPQEERLIKVALTTELLGYSADALYELRADERRWYACVRRFQKYHWLWEQVSFMQMYRSLLTTEQVQARLLSYADGERRLTNVLHLGELLQQTALQAKMNMRRLMHWLAQQRQQETVNEEQQLRLESDEQRLKIVTIHKSKGLEYPIVFCPFLWDGYLYTQKDKQFTFHNEYHELILDLGSNEQAQHRQQALLEERAEQLRLCYVALTRAKHRCYLIWGAFRDAATSALAHLLHPQLAIDQIDDVTLEQALTAFAQHHALQVTPLPLTPYHYQRPTLDAALLTARSFAGEIDDRWQVDPAPMIKNLVLDLSEGAAVSALSARFHNGMAQAVVEVCQQISLDQEPLPVALSGGVFQNRYLTERTASLLRAAGFEVLLHRQVPPNDGGLALGQAAVAAAKQGL